MLLPLLSAAASAAPIPVAHAATGWRSGVAVKPCLDPRPDAVPLQVMVISPGEEADAMSATRCSTAMLWMCAFACS